MENSLLHYLLLHRNFLTLSTEWFSNNIFLLRDSGNKEYVGNVGHGKEFTRASRFEGGGGGGETADCISHCLSPVLG